MRAAPKINRLRRDHNLQLASKADQGQPRKAASTTVNVLLSTPVGTRTMAPSVSISIIGKINGLRGVEPSTESEITTGTKGDPFAPRASKASVLARLRQ
jgi:hypothetical protein